MKNWSTNQHYSKNAYDDYTINQYDMIDRSNAWNFLQINDKLEMVDEKNKRFNGIVIGFNKRGREGDRIYVETSPGVMVYMDAIPNRDRNPLKLLTINDKIL